MNAPRAVVPVIMDLASPRTVLDVGCGTGTWLKAFEESGVSDFVGVDGNYVRREQLKISADQFIAKDLRKAWSIGRTFDLVLSLEVAEHLPEASADHFVETLVRHCGGKIVFSAAIPGQGGQNHLNEQWPEYWQEKFYKHGFFFHDDIRPRIWDNDKVEWWYKQNMFLLTKEKSNNNGSLRRIHPNCFIHVSSTAAAHKQSLLEGRQGLRISAFAFFKALRFKLNKLLGKK